VVIAGGGVAGIEALIALRELLDGFVGIDLVAPGKEFVYRPLSVAEPFGLAEPRRFPLREIAADNGAELRAGLLHAVEHERRVVRLGDGASLSYDALLVAVGARPHDWLEGAVSFAGPEDVGQLRRLVADLDAGILGSVAFVAPAGPTWTLPLYELALLTAAHVAEHARGGVRLTVVSPETSPLEVFGDAAARHVRELCVNRGIELRSATLATAFQNGILEIDPGGSVEADAVVALPKLEGEPIEGLPCDDAGFVLVDEHCAVDGLSGVYAAGDGIAYPVKQGGLATQQADAAAEAIAGELGATIGPRPFRPRLRGQLLTGLGPTYLTAGVTDTGIKESWIAANPLWWPPSKIAGRYLAPYLSSRGTYGRAEELKERPPVSREVAEKVSGEREDVRRLAVTFAEMDARVGDYDSALAWLETIEQLDGLLSPLLLQKRAEWRERTR